MNRRSFLSMIGLAPAVAASEALPQPKGAATVPFVSEYAGAIRLRAINREIAECTRLGIDCMEWIVDDAPVVLRGDDLIHCALSGRRIIRGPDGALYTWQQARQLGLAPAAIRLRPSGSPSDTPRGREAGLQGSSA